MDLAWIPFYVYLLFVDATCCLHRLLAVVHVPLHFWQLLHFVLSSLYGIGRAAMLSATGVSTADLFRLAVFANFGWVWYANENYIIVAVRGSE